MNEAAGGETVKAADAGANEVEWELALRQMTESEWVALAQLFAAVKGGAGTFTFLDPFGNLLAWSEDLGASAWVKTDGLTMAAGVQDPMGSSLATRLTNGSPGEAALRQNIAGPGWFRYCVSVYVRSETPGEASLFVQAGPELKSRAFAINGAWRRLRWSCALGQSGDGVQCGLRVAAGAVVDVFGFQAEAQAGASGYKKTGSRTGVYANAAFAGDALDMTSEGPGAYSCTVRVRASESNAQR